MIDFKKVQGVPANVTSGEDVVWFSGQAGSVYVADNEGHPIRMSAGSLEGQSIPVGTPPAENILYFCTGNGRHYLSNKTEWLELNLKPQSGSTNASGAGRITISDPGNFYTSTDVEGALYEIGSSIYYLLGDKEVRTLNGDALAVSTSGEHLLVNGATTNKPSDSSSWLLQRKGEDDKTYGISVDENGDIFSKSPGGWKEFVSKEDFDTLGGSVTDVLNKRIIAGVGLAISDDGVISKNPTISLNEETINGMLSDFSSSFVAKNNAKGDFMKGPLEVRKNSNSSADKAMNDFILTGAMGASNAEAVNPIGIAYNGSTFRAKDVQANRDFFTYTRSNGKVSLIGTSIDMDGKVVVEDTSTVKGVYSLEVKSPNDNKFRYISKNGYLQLSATTNHNYLISGTPKATPRELVVSAPSAKVLPKITLKSKVVEAEGKIFAGSGMTIGRRENEDHSDVDFSGKLYLFPYKIDPTMTRSTADRYYTHLGYNQDERVLEIRSFFRQAHLPSEKWEEKAVSVQAHKFLSTSSEKFKNVHSKLDEKYNSLEILENVDSWLYDFKADENDKETSGFIIERGVPDFAIETSGTSIDSYAMISVLWDATKKLYARIQELESK